MNTTKIFVAALCAAMLWATGAVALVWRLDDKACSPAIDEVSKPAATEFVPPLVKAGK